MRGKAALSGVSSDAYQAAQDLFYDASDYSDAEYEEGAQKEQPEVSIHTKFDPSEIIDS